ncbi:MAG: ribbon-helix-helix domain-containing protein [Myxococcales bacterium]
MEEKDEVATHVLIPLEIAQKLRELAKHTRVTQSEYLREAVQDLLGKYRPADAARTPVLVQEHAPNE